MLHAQSPYLESTTTGQTDPTSKERGIAVTREMKIGMRNYRTSKLKGWGVVSTISASKKGRTFGGLYEVVDKLIGNPKDDHATYCMGSWIDSRRNYVVAILSTKNLILNGYRMYCEAGVRACVQVDCTYRLMHEGYALAIMGTVSIDKIFHPIAYAIVNKENTAVFQFMLRQVKREIEKVVAEKRSQTQ